MKNIVLISGTNRPGSNTRKITAHLEGVYRDLGQPIELLDLADLPADLFTPASYATKPAAFARFNDAVLASAGLHIVTPEYNGGMPGVLKYFIDLLKHPECFDRRPVAFTGLAAGMWGALRPVEQLQAVFGYRNGYIYPERVFLPGVNALLAPDGTIKHEDSAKRLRAQVEGYIAFTKKLQTA